MQYKKVPFRQKDFHFKSRAIKALVKSDKSFQSDFSNIEIDKIIRMYDIPELQELNYSDDKIRKIFRRGIIESMSMLVKIKDNSGKLKSLTSINPGDYMPSFSTKYNVVIGRVWKDMDGQLRYLDDELIIIDLDFRYDYLISKYEKMVENGKRPEMTIEHLKTLERDIKINMLVQ